MDLNGDGHLDILSGSYSRMDRDMAGLFQVLWGKPKHQFKKAEVLKGTDDKPLIISIKDKSQMTQNICTRPFAVDWDNDGDLDLIVGNFAGTFYLFEGEGKGKFKPKAEPVMANGQPLKINGVHSDPFAIDWDADGDFDLLSGSSNGGVLWAENHAKKGTKTPIFKGFQTLIEPTKRVAFGSMQSEEELTGPSGSTRVWADDVNGDGKLDLLVGDSVYLLAPAKGLSKEEYEKRQADWAKEQDELQRALLDPKATTKERQATNQKYRQHYQKRKAFVDEERTGFVWLYLQK